MSIVPDGNNHKVVSHNPRKEWLIKLILLVVFFGLLVFSYNWGGRHAAESSGQLEQLNADLQERMDAIEVERQQHLQDIAILESARKIDKLAMENVRVLVRQLEDDKARLNKELAFYRSIIAPEEAASGVRVHAFDLLNGDDVREFRLRLVISQVSRINSFLRGNVSVTVDGSLDDEDKSLSLFEMAGQESSSLPLGFRYFQVLPDHREFFEFTLPEGFTPKAVRVAVRIRSGSVQKLNESFDWNRELAADVGQDQKEE